MRYSSSAQRTSSIRQTKGSPRNAGRVLLLQSDGVSARRDPGGPGQTGRQPARQEVRGASRSSQADGPSSDRQGQRGRGRRVFRQLRDASAGNPCTRMAAPTLMRGASSSLYKSLKFIVSKTLPVQGGLLDIIFSDGGYGVSQGLMTSTSSPSKSPIFRVAIERWWALAVPAINASPRCSTRPDR